MFWKRLKRDRNAILGLAILIVMGLVALFAPIISPHDPTDQSLEHQREKPTREHPFGRDIFGRDILSRIIHGSRLTLLAGGFSVALSTVVGTFLGIVSGYYGGWVDSVVMRFIDILLSFPYFLLAILMAAILGPGLWKACVAVAVASMPRTARVVRGSVLAIRDVEYIEAARAMGATDSWIVVRHVLPNVAAPIIVLATLELAGAILHTSGLSFLGLGAQPPSAEWGLMLNEAKGYLTTEPHMSFFPGLFTAILVLGFNLFGDGLRDILDPRLK
ncbi:MAG: ABC transporter permease [Firmicutes bacterium]|jgi:peptide/nickel transport system permease protein|nr:ABC transporter permease [Bacillota bacterium]